MSEETKNYLFQKMMEELEDDPEYIAEGVILAFLETVYNEMKKAGMDYKDLAKKMKVKQKIIKDFFDGSYKFDIYFMVKIAFIFNKRISIKWKEVK